MMRLSKTMGDLIYGTPAFPAYQIGMHLETRRHSMIAARVTDDKHMRATYVRYARAANRGLLGAFAELRRRMKPA